MILLFNLLHLCSLLPTIHLFLKFIYYAISMHRYMNTIYSELKFLVFKILNTSVPSN